MKLTPYQAYHQKHPEAATYKKSFKTLKEISLETGLSIKLLNKRSWKLGLKGKCLGNDGTRFYTEEQINKILTYKKQPKKVSSTKINIIELFQKGMTGKEIAKNMKLSTILAYSCIKEYNTTGFIIVESKLNYTN